MKSFKYKCVLQVFLIFAGCLHINEVKLKLRNASLNKLKKNNNNNNPEHYLNDLESQLWVCYH